MPAYNFSQEFAGDVENRRKTQTIRMSDKGAKVGDSVYLYTGQRTKQCRQLGTATLIALDSISLYDTYVRLNGSLITEQSTLNLLARADGFRDYEAMASWFKIKYKIKSLTLDPIHGYLHAWL